MSLPVNWVEKIFDRLSMIYGREFMTQWHGMDMLEVKRTWAEELAGFIDRPDCIDYALRNLPTDRAPSALKFREICRRAPPPSVLRIEHSVQKTADSDELAAKALAATSVNKKDPKAWAKKLRAREKSGEPLSLIQREFWRIALEVSMSEAA